MIVSFIACQSTFRIEKYESWTRGGRDNRAFGRRFFIFRHVIAIPIAKYSSILRSFQHYFLSINSFGYALLDMQATIIPKKIRMIINLTDSFQIYSIQF